MEILKIERILSTRWVASSYKTLLAVGQDYEALVLYFEKGKSENGQGRKENAHTKGSTERLHQFNLFWILD
jgi:hypothetical protein